MFCKCLLDENHWTKHQTPFFLVRKCTSTFQFHTKQTQFHIHKQFKKQIKWRPDNTHIKSLQYSTIYNISVVVLYSIITICIYIYMLKIISRYIINITLLPIRSPNSATMASSLTSPHLAVSIVELPWSPQTFDENLRFFRFILSVGCTNSATDSV